MAKDVFLRLKADDDISPKLKQIGAAAKATAKDLEAAGKSAKQAGDDAKRGGDSFKDYGDEMRNVGLAAGVLVAGLALSGQSFRDQEIGIRNLQRSYGDAADDMRQFAQQIQDTTNFSNDAGVQAANIAATLARNYGFAADEIQQVLQISADLAATSGLSLEDTTYRVVAALRGEAEAAEALGLTMNQAAIDHDNLTLSMSNQEAGHFRLNALVTQSAFAQGAAAEQADTFYGSLTDIAHGAQDAAQGFGEMLGPLGEAGAFASDNAIQFAAMGLAIGQLVKGGSALKTIITDMGGVANAAKSLGAAIGPGGLVIAGVVAAQLAFMGLKEVLGTDLAEGADQAEASIQRVIDKLIALDDQTLLTASQQALAQQIRQAKDLMMEREELLDAEGKAYGELTDQQLQYYDVNKDGKTTLDEYTLAEKDVIAVLEERKKQGDALIAIQEELDQAQFASGAGAEQYQQSMTKITQAIIAGNLTKEDAIQLANKAQKAFEDEQLAVTLAGDGWVNLGDQMVYVGESGGQAAEGMDEAKTSTEGATTAVQKYLDALRDVSDDGRDYPSVGAGIVTTIPALLVGATAETARLTHGVLEADAAIKEVTTSSAQFNNEQRGLAGGIEAAADAMTYQVGESGRLAAELAKDAEAVAKLEKQYADTFATMQSTATQATDTLDSVFRAIVGNTDAIASQSQSVMDWADGLIGAAGTVGEIDQLLADGAITLDDYTAAQGAYNDIAAANASIQQDVLSIQAQLAPVIATATEALATQMDEIANGSTDAQLFALGMMDAATSSQALALAQGYLSDQDVFGPMLVQAAELNPMLAQILEEMGLISYNPATGEVSLTGVDESQSELSMLTDAMTTLDGTLATLIAILEDNAMDPIIELLTEMGVLDGTTANPSANLTDNASGPLGTIAGLLTSLDGYTVTTYINTVSSFSGSSISPLGYAEGGMVARANGGSVPFIGAEGTGFELMRRGDGGGMQMLPSPGVYSAPQGSMVFPHGASMSMMDNMGGSGITVNVAGSVYGVDDLTATVAAAVAEGMVISRQRYVRGQAV